jgi:hypothetical protein
VSNYEINTVQEYQAYLNTDYWKNVAQEVKRLAGFRCQICNGQNRLNAHHRTYIHRGSEMDHLGDLICLCVTCHRIYHLFIQNDDVKLIDQEAVLAKKYWIKSMSEKQRRRYRSYIQSLSKKMKRPFKLLYLMPLKDLVEMEKQWLYDRYAIFQSRTIDFDD